MVRRKFLAILCLAGFTFVGQGWEIMPLQVVFVRADTPTPLVLAAGTPAELEILRFVIMEPPKHGVLLGIPPELVYVPFPGFLGTDWVSFLIQNASGQLVDFGTVHLRVLAPGALTPPAFRFEGMFVLSGPTVSLDAYSFAFGVFSRRQYLDAQILAGWNQTGFTSFQGTARVELEGTWPAAWRLPVSSTLMFNPTTLALLSWTVDAHVALLGWNFCYSFYYAGTDPQTNSYTLFTLSGAISEVHLTSRTKFTGLALNFAEQVLVLRGPALCPECLHKWEAEYVHKKTGFDRSSLVVRDIPIPCPACGAVQTFLDLKVSFTATEKRVEPALRLEAGVVACVRPFVGLLTPAGGLGIAGIAIWGVEIRCDLPGGYKGRFATSFDPTRDASITGYPQFFEVFQLEGPVKPCCGSPGWWQLSLYFSRSTNRLFGLAMSDIILYFPVSREVLAHLRLKSGLVDPTVPTKAWELTLGWKALF